MRRVFLIMCACSLIGVHIVMVGRTTDAWKSLPKTESVGSLLPGPVLKVVSLEFDGVITDYLFMTTMAYLGSKLEKTKFILTEDEWGRVNQMLTISTDLDPYFVDPYYIANAYLTWDAGMINETNVLLERGIRHRFWDWTLPFFSGFNYFYFLQENDKASEKLMEASRRQGANSILASLASKLAFKAKKTESSILFLEEMSKKTEDESTKKMFERRIEAYKAILLLEQAVAVYRQKFNKSPAAVEDLIKRGIIAKLPKDPYGGAFYIDRQGNVRTTNEHLLIPHLKKPNPTTSSFFPHA